jgi:tetratricopeptide (TPR) repeat protein
VITQKITAETSPQEIWDIIAELREQKGKEKETLVVIEAAIKVGHSFIVNLFFEEALVYQHIAMTERSKDAEERDRAKERRALTKMQAAVKKAEFYVEKYRLKVWKSRVHRFLGRIYDYKSQFKKAAVEYRKAIPLAKDDPDYTEKGYPRWLELQGFLSFSMLMSGETKEGLFLAKQVYSKFDNSKVGIFLKKKDYYTWAVWKSGIPIRTLGAFLDKRLTFEKSEMLSWLSDAEKSLEVPKGLKVWGDMNFQFRRDEIESLRRKLLLS